MTRSCSALLLLAALASLACGDTPERLTAVPGTPSPPATVGCDAVITDVEPHGTLPASRTSPMVVRFAGHALADSVKVQLAGPEGVVPGQLTLGVGVLELRPDAPLAPGAHVVQVSVCDSHALRSFEVGTVHHPVSEHGWQGLTGRTFGLDLRYGAWAEPEARSGRELILRTLFGGALTLQLTGATPEQAVGHLAAGVLQADGTVSTGAAPVAVPLVVDNPYALLPFGSLEVPVAGRTLWLRDGALALGLGDEGLVDVRLSAEADLRDFGDVDGLPVCEILALHTQAACVPCAADDAPTCFALTLEGLSSHN